METLSGQEVAPGFKILDLLCQDNQFSTFRALDLNTNREVILKISKKGELLKEEFDLLNKIHLKGTLSPLSLHIESLPPFSVFENFKGISLRNLIDKDKLLILDKLKIAWSLLLILNEVHEKGCVVKNLNPSILLANAENYEVKLLELSSYHTQEQKESIYSPLEAKESETCDYRSDYYSFGVILYEWLTGMKPSELKAKGRFFAPHIIEPFIPRDLSDLVMKLLSKNIQDRYQSPPILMNDLKSVIDDLSHIDKEMQSQEPQVKPFDPTLPKKLYGREKALETIESMVAAMEKGRPQILFLEGASGVGKTSMEKAIREEIKDRALVVSGKYDAFKSSTPFYGLIEALQSLVHQILRLEEGRLHVWKNLLEENLSLNLFKLHNVLPELGRILGPLENPDSVHPDEKEARLLDGFSKLIQTVIDNKFPMIVFLDDMQWADVSTLDFIVHFFKDLNQGKIFFILSFRKQDIKAIDPPHILKERLSRSFIRYNEIILTPLSFENIVHFLEDTFNTSRDKILPLAEILHSKTLGNPFFLKQLIKFLAEKKIFFFNTQKETWDWSIDEIRKMNIADNVVDLIAGKISNLTPTTRDLLKVAACTGHTFYADLISKVSNLPIQDVKKSILDAVREGFIIRGGEDFTPPADSETLKSSEALQFLHDKVQLAAYSLLAEENKKALHFQIGQYLLQKSEEAGIENEIFEVVYQINRSKDLIHTEEEHLKAAELNLRAGKKAMRSNAYGIASDYLKQALNFLPSARWQKFYDLTFQIHLSLVECIYLQGKFEEAIKEFNLLLTQAKNLDNRLDILHLKIKLFISTANYEEALNTGRFALSLLGVRLPVKPKKIQIFYQYLMARVRLLFKPADFLNKLPPMQDERDLKIVQFLAVMFPPAYLYSKEFLSYLVLWALNKTLDKGITPIAPVVFTCFAVIGNTISRNIKFAYRIGLDSMEMASKFNDRQWISPLNFLFGTFIAPFQIPLRKSLDYLNRSFEVGIAQGDFIYAIFSLIQISYFEMIMGEPLKALSQKVKYRLDVISKLKEENRSQAVFGIYQMIKALRGETDSPASFSDSHFNEKNFFTYLKDKGYFTSKYIMLTFKIELYYLFDLPDMAIDTARRSQNYAYYTQEQPIQVENAFFLGMSLAKSYPSKDMPTRQKIRLELKQIYKKLKKWAKECPENYLMKLKLIEAEMEFMNNDHEKVQKSFDEAILLIQERALVHIEAIAYERYAEYYKSIGNLTLFKQFIGFSHQKYFHWGAIAKVQELEKKYPWLTSQGLIEGEIELKDNPDKLLRIIKKIQQLESSYSKEGFLQTLNKIVVEETDPERVLLLSYENDQFVVQSEWVHGKVLQVKAQDESNCLFLRSLVKEKISLKKPFVISHFLENPKLKNDPYILKFQIDSLIILPFEVNDSKGAIYIENSKEHSKINLESLNLILPSIANGLTRLDKEMHKRRIKKVDLNAIVESEKNELLKELKKEIPHFKLQIMTDYDPEVKEALLNPEEVQVKVHLFLESQIRNSIKNERPIINVKTSLDQHGYKIRCPEENQSLNLEACP